MIQTITKQSFIQAFKDYDRFDQFGYDALVLLFNYLEELEQGTDTPLELDVIALCCEYSHADAATIIRDYNLEQSDDMAEEELSEVARNYLQENTVVCGETSAGFVYCTAF